MTDSGSQPGSLFDRCVSRREMLVVSGGVTVLGLTACAGSPPAPGAQGAQAVSGTFVGKFGTDELIAVVVGPAGDARGLLYGSAPDDPIGTPDTFTELTSEWFDGVALTGDKLEGSSGAGYMLSATLAPDAVRGTVTAPGQPGQAFEAMPATGAAGLYDLSYNPADRTITGSSASGSKVTGTAAAVSDPFASTQVVMTITPADGAPVTIPVGFYPGNNATPERMGFIVAQDGTVRGGPRKGKGGPSRAGTGGGSFTCPLID